jgi:hypothetical protein
MEMKMATTQRLTQEIADSITEDVMASVADILFLTNALSVNPSTGLLEPSNEIANAIRNIEMALGSLTGFTSR